MTNIEVYINNSLCDLSPNFGMRLNRKLISPSELYTKDAQFSYTISFPPTDKNNAIFNYANIEETKNKFNRVYTAVVIVNSVRIFSGNFRLSGIKDGFKGNLFIPALRSIKDIFGDIKLNQNPELRIPFLDFAEYVSLYNNAAAVTPQYAIFPLALFGVIPKIPLNKNANSYSARNIWDDSARLGIQDLPPSINPLLMLRHIFEAQGYNLIGSAYDDERLLKLYQSYKNAPEYVQPWNYGHHAKIHITGSWSATYNKRTGAIDREYERGVNQGSDDTGPMYSTDLLDATNVGVTVIEDTGGNVLIKEINDEDSVTWVTGQIRIPSAGFYKVEFNVNHRLLNNSDWRHTDPKTGIQFLSSTSEEADNRYKNNLYEVRLLRDNKNGDFNLSSPQIVGTFYRDNLPQNDIFDEENSPKYFPQIDSNGQLNLIDKAQDRNIVLGFQFGRNADRGSGWTRYINPKDPGEAWAQIQAAKPAISWDVSENTDAPVKLAIKSPGWWKYGRIGDFDNEGDNPNEEIDYSAGTREYGKLLNGYGQPVSADDAILDTRYADYAIEDDNGLEEEAAGWETSEFIPVRDFVNLRFSGTVPVRTNTAVVAYYDSEHLFIGSDISAPSTGSPDTYTNEPLTPPARAVYVKLGAAISTLLVNADNIAIDNTILYLFPLDRWFTYTFTAPTGSGYNGDLFVFNGPLSTIPEAIIPFVEGVAVLDTSFSFIADFAPYVTFYLKKTEFDVDGTLIIEKSIATGSEDITDWELTNKYNIDLINAPLNFAKRGQQNGAPADDWTNGEGSANAIVWFEAGELLTVASVSSEGRYRRDGMHSTYGLVNHEINFELKVQPFRTDETWLKIDSAGHGTAVMDWNDPVNFDTDSINLVGFLNADMKTDDYIDNFCKAYNLKLSQINQNTFSLDLAQAKTAVSDRFIPLDGIASVRDRENTPLGLPSLYKIGFTIDVEEEGYFVTGDDGGGEYSTGVTDGGVLEQKSNFSFNWFKSITKQETGGDVNLLLPVISKKDVWAVSMPYPDAMRKRYTDQAYRFWYYDGILPGNFEFNGGDLDIAKVSNSIPDSILNYKNEKFTILNNYFTILIQGSSHYTEVDAPLTALQFQEMDGSIMAQFNGDIYYVAELAGYDPLGKNKTIIKLIRKI